MHPQCFNCDRKQGEKIANLLLFDEKQKFELNKIINHYLDHVDISITNPEAMGDLWLLFREFTGIDDPYKEIKHYYNMEVLKCYDELSSMIECSDNPFVTALKAAITGNLIDFSANHTFDLQLLKQMLKDVLEKPLAIDDSSELFQDFKTGKQLLYIGDNCGEIVLDKLFLEVITKTFPQISIYYAVRECPIGNDVTLVDANEVHMSDVANVITNGYPSMGVVLDKSSPQFQDIFSASDIIISKGQGNYEGLFSCIHPHLYFLFMSKCPIISAPLHVSDFSIICKKQSAESI